jgi:hypothetical protein
MLTPYPLSEAANPKPTRFVDGRPYPLHTLPFYDFRALQDIYDIVSVEPVRSRDKVMMGMLATIGIEPGKPFNPPEKLKAAMEKGIADAYYYMQNLVTKLFASHLYWPDRHWSFVMVPDAQRGFEFVNNDEVEIDRRAAAWFFFTMYPKELTDRAGTVYLAPTGGPYKLARRTGAGRRKTYRPGSSGRCLGSFNLDQMKVNADGSVDLFARSIQWIVDEGPRCPVIHRHVWRRSVERSVPHRRDESPCRQPCACLVHA